MATYAVASRLKKTLTEIEAMTVDEFVGWLAFFQIEKEQMENS